MRRMVIATALAAGAMIAAPVSAQNSASSGAYASSALQRGDLVQAEMALEAQRRASPDMPEVLLNLATVFARTNRDARAVDMYRRVLAQDNVSMKLANGRTMDSHALARIGLASLNAAELTTASR
ncbi:tetratricopeptide repeat protein [Stakelama pacifica]|uniref:Tetratricopeptide repeat protein n=2 Tax=Stakelama pacifica TaxID=517720 RepID=A0A4R6FC39_9SPHN|nr:tetratricopeptide repeat protein [Stakelama pacifica]